MEQLYQNKQAFLNEKPKKLFLVSIFLSLFLLVIILTSWKIEVYDHYLTKGYVECSDICKLIATTPTDISIQKIKYNNKYNKPNILSKTLEVDEEKVFSYYIYTFSNDFDLQDKEIVELNFCYNKQRILKKFIKMIF